MKPFSSLVETFDVPGNRLYKIRDRLLRTKKPITDLISGNVTSQGISFPSSFLNRALQAGARQTTYRPDPMGQLVAREAISRYYAQERFKAPARQMILTPGTSISYWYVFKVLADPGDEFLVPSPCYPLFDAIASLCGVKLVPYVLREGERWSIDFSQLESSITPRTKGIILISPHNPTGAVATGAEVRQLAEIAARRHLAIISDEVFSPFVYTDLPLARPAETKAPLVFTLNGFSKMLALPGIKLGWIYVSGEKSLVEKSMQALDMISDTFLPVSEITQAAVPTLLSQSKKFQKEYVAEMRKRRDIAADILKVSPPEGGFMMTLPIQGDEEQLACRLLKEHHILLHPGYFYDVAGQHLVLSFASRPKVLETALRKVIFGLR